MHTESQTAAKKCYYSTTLPNRHSYQLLNTEKSNAFHYLISAVTHNAKLCKSTLGYEKTLWSTVMHHWFKRILFLRLDY